MCLDLCVAPVEDLTHVIFSCPELLEPRQSNTKNLEQFLVKSPSLDTMSLSSEEFNQLVSDENIFTQFVVDPTSMNLPDIYRTNVNDVNLPQICSMTRNLCFSLNQLRTKKLSLLENK